MGIFFSGAEDFAWRSGEKVAVDDGPESGYVRAGAARRRDRGPLNLGSRFASQFRNGSNPHLFGKTQASLFGGFQVFSRHESAALHDGTTKVALSQRRGAKVQHRGSPRGLSEDGDILRIPAKILNICLHPLQRFKLIEHAVVAGGASGIFRGELRMSEKAEDAKAVVDGYQYNALAGQSFTVERRERARALDKASAVKPTMTGRFSEAEDAAVQTFR